MVEAMPQDRAYWVGVVERLATPVLEAAAEGQLQARMPVEARRDHRARRAAVSHLEALARLLCGIAPWLELRGEQGEEETLRARIATQAVAAIDHAVNPASPGRMHFDQHCQAVVEAAFLSQAILRAPTTLWEPLSAPARQRLIAAVQSTRAFPLAYNNWLLFAAAIEAFLYFVGQPYDAVRISYALNKHEEWYAGDGTYGDGPRFHWDYYNSFVIHPMLMDVLAAVGEQQREWQRMREPVTLRAQRYAVIQERLISPEGTIPPIGRSLAYRFGALQGLAQVALLKLLPESLPPAQVRCAMTAVIRRMIEAPGTFDADGWLTIGFCGHQPALGEGYISTGSTYLCSAGLLPLGLPSHERMWQEPELPWTSRRIWSGENVPADHAI